MSKRTNKPPEYIEWDDACSPAEGGWQDVSHSKQLRPSKIHSIGWVLKETKGHVTLVAGCSPNAVDGVICIPKVCITRRSTMVPKKRRGK